MLVCSLTSCSKELEPSTVVSFIIDKKFSNYSGMYCSYDHGFRDALLTVFNKDQLNDFLTFNNDFVSAIAGINQVQAETPNIEAHTAHSVGEADPEIEMLLNAEGADDSIASIGQVDEGVANVTNQLQALHDVVDQWMEFSKDDILKLSYQIINPTFNYNNVNLSTTIEKPSTFGIFSTDPAFSFNLYYTMNAINLIFADSSKNLSITGIEAIYNSDPEVSKPEIEKFISTLHAKIKEYAFEQIVVMNGDLTEMDPVQYDDVKESADYYEGDVAVDADSIVGTIVADLANQLEAALESEVTVSASDNPFG